MPPAPPTLYVQGSSRDALTLRWSLKPHHAPVRGYIMNYKREYGNWEEVCSVCVCQFCKMIDNKVWKCCWKVVIYEWLVLNHVSVFAKLVQTASLSHPTIIVFKCLCDFRLQCLQECSISTPLLCKLILFFNLFFFLLYLIGFFTVQKKKFGTNTTNCSQRN